MLVLGAVGAVVAVSLVAVVGWFAYIWLRRPHLDGPKMFSFWREWEKDPTVALQWALEPFGWTAEIDGTIMTADVGLARKVFNSPEHTRQRSFWFHWSSWTLPTINGVLNMEGEAWKRHSSALHALFQPSSVDRFAQTLDAIARRHVERWVEEGGRAAGPLGALDQAGEERGEGWREYGDLLSAVRGIAVDVLLGFGFGVDVETNERGYALKRELALFWKEIGRINDGGAGAFAAMWDIWWGSLRMRELVRAELESRGMHVQSDDSVREDEPGDAASSRNFFESMVRGGLKFDEIWREVHHAHGANKAIAFVEQGAVWELTRPAGRAWVERLRAEWETVGRVPTLQDMKAAAAMPVTLAVFKETTRMHTVTLATPRKLGMPEEMQGGTLIPTDTELWIAMDTLHRRPDLFPRADEFHPERFLPESHPLFDAHLAPTNRYAWMPFTVGQRQCAGIHLAHLQFAITMRAIFSVADLDVVRPLGTVLHLKSHPYSEYRDQVAFRVRPRRRKA